MGLTFYSNTPTSLIDPGHRDAEILRHEELVSSDGYVPKALVDPSMYSCTAIRARMEWIKQRRAHQLTPLSKEFLARYYDKLENVMFHYCREKSIIAIQECEMRMVRERLLIEIPDWQVEQLLRNSRRLIRLRYLGRWTDHMKKLGVTQSEIDEANDVDPSIQGRLREYWTYVQKAIRGERIWIEQERKAHGCGPLIIETPAIHAVTEAAERLLFDADELLSAVAYYVEKNEAFDTELHELMLEENPRGFGGRIMQDLKYLKWAFSETDKQKGLVEKLKSTIIAFRDTFFYIRPCYEDKLYMWRWNDNFDDVVSRGKIPTISSEQEEIARAWFRRLYQFRVTPRTQERIV